MSVATINAAADAAAAALDAGDYSTARRQALKAKILIAALPDSQRGGGESASELRWRGSEVDAFLVELSKLEAQAAIVADGIHHSKVTYARVTS